MAVLFLILVLRCNEYNGLFNNLKYFSNLTSLVMYGMKMNIIENDFRESEILTFSKNLKYIKRLKVLYLKSIFLL